MNFPKERVNPMTFFNELDLKNQISKGNFSNLYFIFGNDPYLNKYYVNQIVKKTIKTAEEFNLHKADASTDIQQLYDSAAQLPLMSERRCLLIKDIDFDKMSKSELEEYLKLISQPNDTTIIIFWYENVQVDYKQSGNFIKIMAQIQKMGGSVAQIERKKEYDLVKVLCKAAEQRGCRLEPNTARHLINRTSDNLGILMNEIDKLCAYTGSGHITEEAIDKLAVRTVETSVYELANAISAGNSSKALELLNDLFFQRIEPVFIFSVLTMPFVDMYRVFAAESAGLKPKEIADDFGYKKNTLFKLERASASARKLGGSKIMLCLKTLLDADTKIKGLNMDARMVLEQTVVKLLYIASKGVEV